MDKLYLATIYCILLLIVEWSDHFTLCQAENVTDPPCPKGHFMERNGSCQVCGKCLNGTACNMLYGACPTGECEIWYTPQPYCYRYIPADESYLSLAHLAGGPTVIYTGSDEITITFPQVTDIPKELERFYIYNIQYSTKHNDDWIVARNIGIHDDHVILKIQDLMPNTRYYFRVVIQRTFKNVYTDFVTSSSVSSASTICKAPERAEFTSVQQSEDGITLKWKPFISNCNYVKAATLKYNERGLYNSTYKSLGSGGMQEIEVRNLKPMTEYEFSITVTNDEELTTTGRYIQVFKDGKSTFKHPCCTDENSAKECVENSCTTVFAVLIVVLIIAILASVVAIIFAVLFFRERKRKSVSSVTMHYEKPTPNLRRGELPTIPRQQTEQTYDTLNYDQPMEEKIPLTPTENIDKSENLRSSYITMDKPRGDKLYDGDPTYFTPLPDESVNNSHGRDKENGNVDNNRDSYLKPVCH